MNRIEKLFRQKNRNILSIYFTAGFPVLNSVEEIILQLGRNGADLIEIGIPFSDPLADGPVIQETGKIALENGMTVKNLFKQLRRVREKTQVPLVLMGYLNPVVQYGFENFCNDAANCGIDGLIIPDLPEAEFLAGYKEITARAGLLNIFLITPGSSYERIRHIDEITSGFIYMVSSSSTTGKTNNFSRKQLTYFEKVSAMNLKNPLLAGFGIHNRETREQVSSFVNGVIVGSAYMRALTGGKTIEESTGNFMSSLEL